MSRRRRGLLVALLAAVLLLFAGRWAASFLADGWWAAQFSPSARTFLSGIRLLRLTIDAAAVVLAAGWFIGHLIVVVRAVGSVQIPRHVANLEFREAVRGDRQHVELGAPVDCDVAEFCTGTTGQYTWHRPPYRVGAAGPGPTGLRP